MLSRADEFIAATDTTAWKAAANYQLGADGPVDAAVLQMFASAQVGETTVVKLAERDPCWQSRSSG